MAAAENHAILAVIREDLKEEINFKNTDLKGKIKCLLCNGRFSKQSILNNHMRLAHDKKSMRNRAFAKGEHFDLQNTKSILNEPPRHIYEEKKISEGKDQNVSDEKSNRC